MTVCSDIPYSPFEFEEDEGSGEYTGFDVALVDAVAGELGLDTEWRVTVFDTILASLAVSLTVTPVLSYWLLPQARVMSHERDGWLLKGRVDRIDDDGEHQVVVDYKTGAPPSKADMGEGEAVQLPHYALQLTQVAAIEYWDLKNRKCVTLAGEALDSLLPQVAARLGRLAEDIRHGRPLPANGVEAVCERCDFSGVCRRGDWLGATS